MCLCEDGADIQGEGLGRENGHPSYDREAGPMYGRDGGASGDGVFIQRLSYGVFESRIEVTLES